MNNAGWMAKLHRKAGEKVFRGALEDLQAGKLRRVEAAHRTALLLSLFVMLSPVALIVAGGVIAVAALPSLGGIFWGGLLIAVGVFLLPARFRAPERALRRNDAPRLFKDLDRVSEALGAPKVTVVAVDGSFNAFAAMHRKEVVLGIGAVLWDASSPEQRLALVAHETAHFVNGDPSRTRVIGFALQMLDKWEMLLEPDFGDAAHAFAALLLLPFRWLVALLNETIRTLLYVQMQRAEYLADALAAEAAGGNAVKQLLSTISLSEYIDEQWSTRHGVGSARGRDVIKMIVEPVVQLNADERVEIAMGNGKVDHSVDTTHPPTHYRIAFLDAACLTKRKILNNLFDREDMSFEKAFDAVGESLAAQLEVQ
ncbi:Zn-dependent protease with chaperone function [Yoonia maritima]|uniref:Zn-dependent protease with chaperone function n=2 Tax=Yoonia maritima TaxID=1435347 RepID=A0A2T0W2G6_9RHOB|nr:Zn-dependent protease with chaperone function [Yoonia maritima]